VLTGGGEGGPEPPYCQKLLVVHTAENEKSWRARLPPCFGLPITLGGHEYTSLYYRYSGSVLASYPWSRVTTLPIHERDHDFLSFAVTACFAASRESRSRFDGGRRGRGDLVGVLQPCRSAQHQVQHVQVGAVITSFQLI
jgi:hypothetical protein